MDITNSEDAKWVWNKNDQRNNPRGGKLFDDVLNQAADLIDEAAADARYEIYERPDDYYRPIGNRPIGGLNRPSRPGFLPHERPGGLGGLYENGDGYYGGSNGHPGVLTGPAPPPFKQFDTCKCAERFNCQSPGISYGHCDVGKQYCCYNKRGGIVGGLPPSRPVHSPENGILVGPGGPFDGPSYNQPNHGNHPGVLVGPDGPTGIIGPIGPTGIGGRPINRPNYHQNGGVLVGPGGPYDRPIGPRPHYPGPIGGLSGGGGFGYGRSRKD